jgi:putative heme transporter
LRRALVMLLKIVIAVAACAFLLDLLRGVDWAQVWAALGRLTALQIALLLVLVGVRQTLNAAPMAMFITGLGMRRAVDGDLSAGVVSTAAPPPSDVVLRFSMFRSWGIDDAKGAVGASLNTLNIYIVRFAAPVLGFFVLLAFEGYDSAYATTAVACGLVAVTIVVSLILVARADRFAAAVGSLGGRIGHRFRPEMVDPERGAATMVRFRSHAAERLKARAPWAALALLGLLLAEALFITGTMRFMGLPSVELTFAEISAGILCAYPLICLPFAGIGVLDAALLGLYTERGASDEPTVIAALVVWRLGTVLLPLALGLGTLMRWRRAHPADAKRARPAVQAGDIQPRIDRSTTLSDDR